MKNYIATISKSSPWETMYILEPEISTTAIEQWLSSSGPLSLCMNTMNMINEAIGYVITNDIKNCRS